MCLPPRMFCYSPQFDLISLSSLNFIFRYPLTSTVLSPLTSCILSDKQGSTTKTSVRFHFTELLHFVALTTLSVSYLIQCCAVAVWLAHDSKVAKRPGLSKRERLCLCLNEHCDLEQIAQLRDASAELLQMSN